VRATLLVAVTGTNQVPVKRRASAASTRVTSKPMPSITVRTASYGGLQFPGLLVDAAASLFGSLGEQRAKSYLPAGVSA
jgi:hypothetical protein